MAKRTQIQRMLRDAKAWAKDANDILAGVEGNAAASDIQSLRTAANLFQQTAMELARIEGHIQGYTEARNSK